MIRSRTGRSRPSRRSRVALDLVEVGALQDDAVLDDLRESGAELPVGQGPYHGRIDDDEARLVERADQVLGLGMVDGGLAADRGVDLGQDGGGQRDEVEAAHVGGGHEPRQVADRAPAEPEHRRAAVEAGGEQAVPAVLGDGQGLGGLALRDLDHRHRESRALEAGDDRRPVQAPDAGVGEQRGPPAPDDGAQALTDAAEGTGLDHDGVRLGPEIDGDVHQRVPAARSAAPGAMVRQAGELVASITGSPRIRDPGEPANTKATAWG